MADEDEVVEIPIEAAQEYIACGIGIAPLGISDEIYNIMIAGLDELVEDVVSDLHIKYEKYLTQPKVDALRRMLKIKLQGQQNVLFDNFDNFIITNLLNINDDAVLPEDLPQTTYSRKKHELVKKSIEKHESNLHVLNSVRKSLLQQSADLKVVQEDMDGALQGVQKAIKSIFGDITIEEFRKRVKGIVNHLEGVENVVTRSQ